MQRLCPRALGISLGPTCNDHGHGLCPGAWCLSRYRRKTWLRVKSPNRRSIEGFAIHFAVYAIVVGAFAYMNYTRNPDNMWVMWVAGGWGLGLVLHAILGFHPGDAREGRS
ncbi:2TM domain-containing protein [Planctomyces sp. SH-PL14]|uniref:2TM domain-containing protein n=1 Tax=Planctomyces sp. SH-PL14 TaxID=1632864 RepID=UPI0012E88D1C